MKKYLDDNATTPHASEPPDAVTLRYYDAANTTPLPECIRGDVLNRCVSVGNFLRWRIASSHAPDAHLAQWREWFYVVEPLPTPPANNSNDSAISANDEEDFSADFDAVIKDLNADLATDANGAQQPSEAVAQCLLYDRSNAQTQLSQFGDDRWETNITQLWLTRLADGEQCEKPLRLATLTHVEAMHVVMDNFPNMRDAARAITGAVILQAEKSLPIRLPRLMLNGEPGCGKTEFIRATATALELPLIDITLSAVNGEFELPGGHRSWRNAQPGRLFLRLFESAIGNPIFLFDEAERGRLSAQNALLAWLENTHYRDQCLEMDINSQHVNSVLITNTLNTLDAAIQSRCQHVEIATLSSADKRAIIPRIYTKLLTRDEFSGFDPTLADTIITSLITQPLRSVRVILQSALFNAALHQRRSLTLDDITIETKRTMGFI